MEDFIISDKYDGKPRKLYKKKCLECGDSFYIPKHKPAKYCSIKCSAKRRQTVFNLICAFCNKEYIVHKLGISKSGLRFCSRSCKDKGQRIEKYGKILRPNCLKDGKSSYREVAFRHYPHNCNRCGYNDVTGILKVHHRDRNRNHNDVENLELLCPICHDLDHYFKGDGPYGGGRKRAVGVIVSTKPLQGLS
jgi:hypothetical protein